MATTVDKFTSSCSLIREKEREIETEFGSFTRLFLTRTISRDINDGVKGNNGWPTGVSIGG